MLTFFNAPVNDNIIFLLHTISFLFTFIFAFLELSHCSFTSKGGAKIDIFLYWKLNICCPFQTKEYYKIFWVGMNKLIFLTFKECTDSPLGEKK